MRVIVCGSRDWQKRAPIWTYLSGLFTTLPSNDSLHLIQGGAPGADRIARQWYEHMKNDERFGPFDGLVTHEEFKAKWDEHGNMAGRLRNQEMLAQGPDLVLAFKNNFNWKLSSGGTEHMVGIALEAGISTYVIGEANECKA